MTQRTRLEDLGRIYELLDQLIDNEFFEHLNSKHDYESWMKKHFPAYKVDDTDSLLDAKFFEIHHQLREIKENLLEIWSIARGEDE